MANEGDAERLVVLLEARITDFEKNFAKANATAAKNWTQIEARSKQAGARIQREAEKSSGGVLASFGKLGGLAKGGLAAIGITAGIAGVEKLYSSIRGVVKGAGDLVDTADKIGITTDALQKLHFAGQQAGVEFDAMDQALAKFSENVGDASRGGGDLYDILKLNNVAIRDQAGNVRPLIDLFRDYADLVAKAGSSEEKSLLTTKAFGKSADELGNLFQNGAAGVDQATAAAVKLGAVIDDGKLRRIAEVDDAWDAFATTLDTQVKSAVLGVVDAMDLLGRRLPTVTANVEGQLKATEQQIADLNQQIQGFYDELNSPINRGAQLIKLDISEATQKLNTLTTMAAGYRSFLEGHPATPTTPAAPAPPTKPTIIPPAGDLAKQHDAVAGVIEQLKFEGDQLGRTADQQELYNKLKQAGVDLDSEAGQKIAALVTKNEAAQKSMDALTAAQERFNQASEFLGQSAVDALDGIIVQGDKASDVLANLVKQLASALLQAGLTGSGPLAGILGIAAPASGGLGGLFGAIFGGARAAGGPVTSGQAYLVGERGPEMIVPRQSGIVVPAQASKAGDTITFAPTSNIHLHGPTTEAMQANFKTELDRRDKRWIAQLPDVLRRHQMNNRL